MTGQKIAVQGKRNTWRLRAYIGRSETGSPRFMSETFKGGSREADAELAALVAKADAAKSRAAGGTETVGALLDRFIEQAESLGRSPTTLRKYRQITEAVLRPELGAMSLDKLSALDLDKLYAKLTAKGNKATTVRRVHALIGAALAQAVKWDAVPTNVALKATPPVVRRADIIAPRPEQVQRIVEAAEAIEPMLAALLFLAAICGARRGELCALHWTDLDWQAGTLHIDKSLYETKGGGYAEKDTKTHAARSVELGAAGLELLRRHRQQVDGLAQRLDLAMAPDAYMFSRSPQGLEPVRPDVVTKFAAKVAKQVGANDVHMHSLRHYAATQTMALGFDPVSGADRLGHADSSVFLRVYAKPVAERRKELAAALEGTLSLPKASADNK